jgi:DNA-binding transcriptional LysR family regulator
MDTEFLDSFVMVVEHGSVAEAARHLNLTPAAVTQRIRALEKEIGTSLVSRLGRTMRPTEAGAAVLHQAQSLVRGVRDLRALANEQNFAGELGLGAISSALTGILPPLLVHLAKKHPLMTLYIHPGTSADLYRKVADGELDAAVIIQPQFPLPKSCAWTTWREEPLVLLVHRGIKDRDVHKILGTEPFIRYDRKQWGGRLAETYLQQAGIRPKDHYELDSLDAIAVLVDRELGVSLVPDWAPPWPAGLNLTKLPVPVPFEKRRIGLLWRRASARLRLVQALMAEPRD